jgi:hypothetical protein
MGLMAMAGVASSQSQVLWYNGDFDGRGGFAAIRGGEVFDSRVYDDFAITGTAAVTSHVFANLFVTEFLAQEPILYWEIRRNVSEGNGGTIIAAATNSATAVRTGRFFQQFFEYRFRTEAVVTLAPGIYWLGVAAVSPRQGQGRSFIGTTLGNDLNPGSDPNPPPEGYRKGNSFVDSSSFQLQFTTGEKATGVDPADFSMGVEGVPEPATLAVLGLGLAALATRRRR